MKWDLLCYRLSFASLVVLVLGIFTSVSFSALSHILLIVPGIYFLIGHLKDPDFKLSAPFWVLLALTAICWASVLANLDIIQNPWWNIKKTKYFVMALLSVFAYHHTLKNYLNDKKISLLIHLFLLATSVATISGLIGLWSGYNPLKMKTACHATRACGLYGMYMTYGYGISLFMVLLSGALVYREKLNQWVSTKVLIAAWLINLVGLALSFARGAWLGFLIAAPFYFYKKHKQAFVGTILAGAILLGGAFTLSPKVRDTFLKREGSNTQRLAFYRAAWEAAKEKPLLGWGYRNFEPNVTAIKKRHAIEWPGIGGHAHNNFLEHLASTGFMGALAFLLFTLVWLWRTYQHQQLLFPFVVSFIVSGMTQYTFGDGENLFLIMSLFALSCIPLSRGSSTYS